MSDDWPQATLADVVALNPEATKGWPNERTIRYVDLSSVTEAAGIDGEALSEVTLGEAPGRARRVIRKDDVLVATVRPYLRGFASVPPELDGEVASTGFAVLRSRDDKVMPRFVWALVRTDAFVDFLMSRSTGSNYPAVRAKDIGEYVFRLPPVEEQRRIVDFVGAMDVLTSAAAGVVSALDQAMIAYVSRVGMDLEGSRTVELGQVAEVLGGITKDIKKQDADYAEVPYLRVANVQRGYLDLSDVTTIRVPAARLHKLALKVGDVLFNEGGDRDKLGRGWVWEGEISPCVCQNHVFRARLLGDRFDPYFVSIWANSPSGQHWFETMGSQTTNLASINMRTLRAFPVPEVDRATQQSVMDTYMALRSGREAAAAEVAAFRSLRNVTLSELVDGSRRIPISYDELMKRAS